MRDIAVVAFVLSLAAGCAAAPVPPLDERTVPVRITDVDSDGVCEVDPAGPVEIYLGVPEEPDTVRWESELGRAKVVLRQKGGPGRLTPNQPEIPRRRRVTEASAAAAGEWVYEIRARTWLGSKCELDPVICIKDGSGDCAP